MLQAFIVTLREGVEAALIIGITLAYLAKLQRPDLRKSVFAALATAFVASIGVAIALSRFEVNEDLFEGWVMLVAAVFVISMVIFMMRAGRRMKGDIEGRLNTLASRSSQIGIFLFVFLMVLREGAETVLILSAVSLESTALLSFLGTLLGVLAAVVFGVMFVKGSVRINIQKFFRVTTVILFFVAAQLLVSGLHELSETGVLPSSRQEMALIGPIVRNDAFFFVTILALAALMVLFESRRRQPVPVAGASPAHRRKSQWTARRERFWTIAVFASSFLFILLVTAEFIYAKEVNPLSPATEVSFSDGILRIPVAQVSDGDLHRFSARASGTEVRFLFYRKPDGKLVAVFDACQICGPVGFFKGANGLVCKNCAAPINPQSVGTPGGCNPLPLTTTAVGDTVVVREADLALHAQVFRK